MPSGARHRTGTMQLRRYGLAKPRQADKTEDKYTARLIYGIWTDIFNTKQGHIGKNQSEKVIAEFAPKLENLKPLARETRSVLFQLEIRHLYRNVLRQRYNVRWAGQGIRQGNCIDENCVAYYWGFLLLFFLLQRAWENCTIQ